MAAVCVSLRAAAAGRWHCLPGGHTAAAGNAPLPHALGKSLHAPCARELGSRHTQMPPCSLQATKRLCECHLAQQLCSPVRPGAPPEDGLLTMDAARSLLPLGPSDAQVCSSQVSSSSPPCAAARCKAARAVQVYSVPLVGVWLRGVASVDHPLVAAACCRYAHRCVCGPVRLARMRPGA
jgi:hypothetical protein